MTLDLQNYPTLADVLTAFGIKRLAEKTKVSAALVYRIAGAAHESCPVHRIEELVGAMREIQRQDRLTIPVPNANEAKTLWHQERERRLARKFQRRKVSP